MPTRSLVTASILTFGFLAAAITAPGCQSGGTKAITDMATSSIKSLVGDWDLTKLSGVDISSLLPQGSKVPSLSFLDDGKVSGSTGVNRLTSSLDLSKLAKGDFSLAPAATTRMAGSPQAMTVEQQFTSLLSQANQFKVSGNNLTLLDKGKELLGFVKR